MKRLSPLLFLSTLALAQVGLVDGPRPSTEVRGTLQGNAREGYRVVVEFLVENRANPVQGSMNQSLSWDGKLYLCVSGCNYFTLSGYAPNTPYNQTVFNLYDSQNRLRGQASVSTVYDSQNRPSYHQVQYTVWPLQEAKTWMPSPDNPVPLEAGGWLSARPPGGSARERYRYPGKESYRPPSVQGSILSGISPADRDVVAKSVLSSLGDLRAFYARQPQGSTLWFFVSEVSAWTQTLAQEFRARNGGRERFVVPEGKAREYCSLYRSDTRYHVMPRESLAKEQSFAVIYPPSGSTQKGAVMAGRFLVDRPDWPEGPDCLSQTVALVSTTSDLPEARAYLYGCISQANLKAQVQFKETSLGPVEYVDYRTYRGNWDGKDSFDLGNGRETIRLSVKGVSPNTWIRVEPALDAQDRNRGYARVYWKHNLRETIQGYYVYWYLSRWQTTWRAAKDNDRPVEAGGYVTAEGKRYRIPGLEGYLQPTGKDLEVAEGDPYVSYITRSISPQGNPLAGTGREEARVWFKPLRGWCAERGL